MKKIYLLFTTAIMLLAGSIFGQNYQLPYCDFESWFNTTDNLPSYWYSYSAMDCNFEPECTTARAAGVFDNHHAKVSGYNGGYAIQLYSIERATKTINGAITTGKSLVQSTDFSSNDNYVYTQKSGSCKWPFSGRPDSLSMRVRFSFLQNTYPNAMAKIHIHGDVDYEDHPASTISTPQTGKIANMICYITNPATTPTNGVYKSGWTRFAYKFNYWDANNNPIDHPTLANTSQPYYMLASLSTNQILGVGEGDSITFDKIFCIYDKGLASLKVNGVELDAIREVFNNGELYFHDMINSSGQWHAYINDQYCYSPDGSEIPIVTATPKSGLVLSCTVTQLNINVPNPEALITVMHNDSSTFVYHLHFNNLKTSSPLTLNHPDSVYTSCKDNPAIVTVSGAESYVWSTGETTASIQPNSSGHYQVTGTNSFGCPSTTVAYVTVNPLPTVTITGNTSTCTGTSSNLIAGGAESYVWSSGATTNSITVPTNESGTYAYTVTGTSSAGCTNTAQTEVTVHPRPVVTISGNNVFCSGSSTTFTATGASSYLWSTGSTTDALTITETGTYSVTGTSDYGCTATASRSATKKTTPSVSISGPSTFCLTPGNTFTLGASSNQPNVSYSWSNNTSGNTLTSDQPGTYSVTATLDGCSSEASHTVTGITNPTAPTASSVSRCGSGSVTLTATPAPECNCVWYASANTQDTLATGNTFTTPGLSTNRNYYVCSQNEYNCFSSRTMVSVTINPLPAAPTVSNPSYCGEGNYTLNASSPYSVQWYSDAACTNSIGTTQHISQTTTFYAKAIDDNQCESAAASSTVTINPIPGTPTVSQPAPICINANSSTRVSLSATPGSNGTGISWYNNQMAIVGHNPNYQANNITASTTYYASTTSATCESQKVAVNVVINYNPEAPTLSCEPRCGSGTVSLIGNANGLTLKWYDANDNYLGSGSPFPVNITGTTVFKAKAVNGTTNCESPFSSVTAVMYPTYETEFTITSCDAYVWNNVTYTQSGNYNHTYVSVSGCDSIVTLHLTINNSYNTSFDTTVCDQFVWDGQSYTASGDIVKHYTSKTGCDSTVTCHLTILHSTTSSQSVTVCANGLPFEYAGTQITSAGTRTIVIPNSAGCDSTITLTVNVNPIPGAPTIPTNAARCGAGPITLTASPGTNGTVCRWYATATASTPLITDNSFPTNISGDTTFYVSSYNNSTHCEGARVAVSVTMNAVPSLPQVSNAARCGNGDVTLTAVLGDNATTCRWFQNNAQTTTEPLHTGPSYSPYLTAPTTATYYVESYNTTTNCKSNRTPVTATANAIPNIPQVTNATNCGPLTADLADYITGNTSPLYRWYDNNDILLTQNANYSTTVSSSTTFKVSGYNAQTTCESEKNTISITIYPTYAPQSIYDTICQNGHYQSHGIDQTFTIAGDFPFVLSQQSSNGCDSLVTLYIHVKPQITNTITEQACVQYVWNDIPYNQSGTYTQTFQAANGCDSIVTLQLTIHPTVTSQFTASACTSYTWNNTTYTQSGDYQQHFTNIHGCDSTVTLHLTIYPTVSTEFWDTACVTYTWNNESYTQTGDYTQHFSNIHDCDSAVTLHLTIYPNVTYEFWDTACVSYTWNTSTYTNSGDYTKSFSNIHGCDSTVTLHLTIHTPNQVSVTGQVCAGTPYQDYGFDTTFAQAGTYTLVHEDENIYGCDSTTTLQLTVNPVFQTTLNESICYDDTYDFLGQILNVGGTYVDTLPTANGCDSIIILNLTVFPEKRDTLYDEICFGDSYHLNGFDISQPAASGTYFMINDDVNGCDSTTTLFLTVNMPAATEVYGVRCQGEIYNENGFNIQTLTAGEFTNYLNLQTSHGCDSTVTLHLTVHPIENIQLVDTVCAGEPYTNYGFDTVLTQVRNHTLVYNGQTIHGCDSTVTLTVTVNPVLRTTLNESFCFNGSYNFHGTILTAAGTYLDTLSTVKGCDSIITLHLSIYPERRDTLFGAICLGESYTQNGFNITNATTSGYHSITSSDVHGCDSTTVLYLVVNQPAATAVTGSICLGESYTENGFNLTPAAAGIVTDTLHLQTSHGCDSTVTLTLTVRPTSTFEFSATACTSYQWNDSIYYQSGDFVQHFNNVNDCDSTVTLHLTINPTSTHEFSATACTSYQWNDSIYYQSGDFVQHFNNIYGCDSTVTLHLTINPTSTYEFSATACTSYQWNDSIYYQSGNFVQHFDNVYGCDSTVTLHLTINPTSTYEFSAAACTSYQWNDSIYYQSGDFIQHFNNVYGCDSTVTLHLTINPTSTYEFSATACTSYQWNDSIYYQSGDFVQHFDNVYGCDSTVTLHLTINPTSTYEFSATACTSYQWNDSFYYQSGDFVQHFNNVYGCDSTVTLHLTINPTSTYEFSATACTSYQWNDSIYYQSGDFIQHFDNVNGCDSTVTLHLTINPTSTYEFSATACTSYQWNDSFYYQSGDFVQHFNNVYGCDSTVTLHLTINPTATHDFWDTACVSYTWANTTYTQSGNYTKHFETIHGCDSTVTLHLTIHTPSQVSFFEHICANDHYNNHGFDTTITQPGVFTLTHQDVNIYGCDSTTTLQLTVHELDTTHISASICRGEQYTDNGFNIPTSDLEPGEHDFYRYENVSYGCEYTLILHLTVNPLPVVNLLDTVCAGTPFSAYGFDTTITVAGNYTMTHVNPSIHGCDSTTTLQLTVHPTYHTNLNASICFDSSYNFNGEILTASGVYYDTLQTVDGCDSTFTLNLTVFPEKRDTLSDAVCLGDSYQLHGFDIQQATVTGYHSIVNPDVHGCDSTTVLYLVVNQPAATAVTGSICLGESYTENGFNLTPAAAGIVTDTLHLQTSHGCDSTVTLTLTVRPTSTFEFSATACTSYQWNDSIYYQSGDFVQHFNNVNDCDSTVTLHLTINPTSTHEFSATACTSYQWNDSIYYQSGDFVQHFNNIYGCDSTVTLHLTINPTSTYEFSATACTSYQWNDSIYYQSGNFVQHFDNVYGCDSTVTLHLTINPTSTYEFSAAACTSYQWNDSIYYQSGDFIQHFNNVYGCDSTVTLHLTINPTATYTFWDTACVSYTWANTTYTQSGDYTKQFETIHGCDSTVTLHLTIYSIDQVSLTDQVCAGEPYSNYGFDTVIAQAGTYTLTHQNLNVNGCDSTTTLQLTVHPVFHTTLNKNICFNGSYNFNGEILTTSGTYYDTLQTVNGCDSTFVLNLTVYSEKRDTIYDEICLGDSYEQYGFNIQQPTTSGFHTIVTPDAHGCDSTTVLYLTVNEPATTILYGERCQGIRYNENGFNVFTFNTGTFTYYQQRYTSHGCDSLVTLYLTVYPIENIEVADTVCAGDHYVNYGFDTVLTQARKYTMVHYEQNIHGCDSTFTLQLTVNPIKRTTLTESICFNETYDFHGEILSTAGIYVDTLTSASGCDSIVTLKLYVYPEKIRNITDHICRGDSYYQYGFEIINPQETQTYQHTDPDVHGCDSTTILELMVHELDTTHINASICSGETYTDNGFNILTSEPGEYEYTRSESAAFGCEYTLVLHLTVNPVHNITLADEICAGIPYAAHGFDTLITQAGNYSLTNYEKNIYGCDSTTTLNLTVYPVFSTTINKSICYNESYSFKGETLNTTGTYVDSLHTINGCDSIITLNLTVYPERRDTIVAHICQGESYNEYNFAIETPAESGTFTHTDADIHGCDSTTVLQLFVHSLDTTHYQASVCQGETYMDNGFEIQTTEPGDFDYIRTESTDHGCQFTFMLHLNVRPTHTTAFADTACVSYDWNDTTFTESGDYTMTFTNASGCDSTVTLHLTIRPANTYEFSVNACDSFVWNQTTYTESGDYTLTLTNEYGCDSVVTMHLNVNPTYATDTTVSICDNMLPFYWNGNTSLAFHEAGNFDIPFTTVAGCDSIIHLRLNVNPTYVQDTIITVCNGALPYSFDENHSFDHAGNFVVNLLSENGCDSIWNIQLIVTPNIEHESTQTICDSQLPYTYMGETFNEAGNYDIITSDGDSCLTINHLTLIVNPTYHGYDTVTVCQETLPYTYGTTMMTTSGDYDVHFSSVSTCDSLISVHFTVIPTAQGVDEMFVCASDFPVVYGGETFNAEGVYPITFHRDGLCDSIVTLTIHQASEYLLTQTDDVCDHELPYLWRGEELTQTGIYFDSLVSQYGCDSIYRLQLTVNETQLVVNDPIMICQGDSAFWRGVFLYEAGIYRDTVTNDLTGCRIIHEVSVTVNPSYLFEETVILCSDELPYQWHGITLNEAGSREIFLQTAGSFCDSIYRLTLVVNPASHTEETATVCDYDLPFLWHGQTLTESGIYYDTLVTTAGCDSTFTLTFTVNASAHIVTADTVCQNELPYVWRGQLLSAAGHYTDTLPNAAGCLDIFELNLSINTPDVQSIYDTICQGETYQIHGFDTLAAQAGTLYDQIVLTNESGCDSIVNLILTVLPSYLFETYAETCENVPYAWHDGEFITEGTYYDSLVTANGCDSVYILHLTINPTYEVFVSDSAINGHEYQYDNFVVTPSDSGTFHYNIQYYTVAGCDSVVHLTLLVAFNDGIEEFEMMPEFSFFPNPTQAALNITGERMSRIHVYDLSGRLVLIADPDTPEQTRINVTGFATGHYVVRVTLDDGKTVTGKIIVNRR